LELVLVHEAVEMGEDEEEELGWKIQQLGHGGNSRLEMEIKVQDIGKYESENGA
jgi:hypothetical protein